MHFEHLEPDSEEDSQALFDFLELFREVGDALRTENLYQEALRFYARIAGLVPHSDDKFFKYLAHCYREAGLIDKAEECWRIYARTRIGFSDIVGQRDFIQFLTDAGQEALAEPYRAELAWKRRRTFKLVSGLSRRGGPMILGDPDAPIESIELPEEDDDAIDQDGQAIRKLARKRGGRQQGAMPPLEEQDNLQPIFSTLKELRGQVEGGDKAARTKWMQNASSLLGIFGRAPVFFPFDRNVKFLGYSSDARTRASASRKRLQEMEAARADALGIPIGIIFP